MMFEIPGGASAYATLTLQLTPQFGRKYRVTSMFVAAGSTAPTTRRGEVVFDTEYIRDAAHDVDEYAKRLSEALFADEETRSAFSTAQDLAERLNQQLRVQLFVDSDDPDVHTLRWEMLRAPDGTSVTTGERIIFSRFLTSSTWRRVAAVSDRDLRAVVIIANPGDLGSYQPEGVGLEPIDVAAERERAARALGAMPITWLAERGSATLENLVDAVREGCNLVYLVCHGAFFAGQSRLYLENETGDTVTASGVDLVREFRQLRQLPSLVVLASCQSGGSASAGALAAVGPSLAALGVPAVLAMQERISVKTSDVFVETFFTELKRDGRLDRAAAVARTRVKAEPDFWVPVLFSRQQDGCLWHQTVDGRADFEKWPALLGYISDGVCTPILGPGLIEFLLGSTREIAQHWADMYRFPMAPHERGDLPHVAQFLAVKLDPNYPARELTDYVQQELVKRYGPLSANGGGEVEQHVRELAKRAGHEQRLRNEHDAYRVLAALPFPIYVTANPDNMLADALEEADKDPVVELCRWREDVDFESIWDREPSYKPSVKRPLVFHIFGQLRERDSLVLTEDNFFDFLLRINNPDWNIPSAVRAAWSKNALLFLGFQTEQWSFRVLFRTIMGQSGGSLRNRKSHVAVQIDPEEATIDPPKAREYLEDYFNVAQIATYWGSTQSFIDELMFLWHQTGRAL
jgi:hypothetical protein